MKQLLLAILLVLIASVSGSMSSQAQSTARLVTVLASAARTADTTGSDITNLSENLNVKGVYITLDVTAITASPLITPSVQIKDPVSGKYETIFTATAGVSAQGTHTYVIYPGVGAATGDVVQTLSYPLPPAWRVFVDHLDADSITYSVGAMLVQ